MGLPPPEPPCSQAEGAPESIPREEEGGTPSFLEDCVEVPPGSVGPVITSERPRRGRARQSSPRSRAWSQRGCFSLLARFPGGRAAAPEEAQVLLGFLEPSLRGGLPGSCWPRSPCLEGFAHLSPSTSQAEGKPQETGRGDNALSGLRLMGQNLG